MIGNFFKAFTVPEIRNKILAIAGLIIGFRLLATIPIPGVDLASLQQLFGSNQLLGFLNLFSGGGLSNLSIMMLGVGPYITATIIMQLLTMISPRIKEIYYESGAAGRAKFNQISRYLTVPLAALQGFGFLNLLRSQGVLPEMTAIGLIENIVIITAGSLVLTWIGELISEYKIGNGISIIIFAGIVAALPGTVRNLFATYSPELLQTYIVFALLAVVIIAGVVFVSEGERKVPVTYAKRVRGNKVYGGATSYLPLKVNQAGVIPIIFAISILLFPQFVAQIAALFSPDLSLTLQNWVNIVFNNQIIYILFYFLLVVVFTYFYTAITFNPEEISKSLQQSGGFVPGIRPGQPTTDFLKSTTGRITLFGAIFLGVVAVLPNIVQLFTGVQAFALGGTALLIVVAVALEIARQISSQLTVREYEGIGY
ncbi:MAG: preprotein translocase subunit SecY [Candidatus Harrisonbacteria bacterium CG10_big_fil_rev_8_21_14_0_10_49_15]|uniref:Protein translocase subunit SecY n=1 Tax=Candidatus Harrisonbacteria bacterium CG10_big_fil_rev_8_21_14_0_10_49_15 TaxID=1974587 RepID=A0A2H0UN29_9BACT|nr:MAG: preprotein translocase subunit SecY [Candidatus Harrisonbacteria bacterium CG10_big_fil_rev_8_21_14_0_10_49_15]